MLANIGDRIELLAMPDDPDPIPVGTKGTVDYVSDPIHFRGEAPWVQIGVKWDNGRTLALVSRKDRHGPIEPTSQCGALVDFSLLRVTHGYPQPCMATPVARCGLPCRGLGGADSSALRKKYLPCYRNPARSGRPANAR